MKRLRAAVHWTIVGFFMLLFLAVCIGLFVFGQFLYEGIHITDF
jgi:hypothetical protein